MNVNANIQKYFFFNFLITFTKIIVLHHVISIIFKLKKKLLSVIYLNSKKELRTTILNLKTTPRRFCLFRRNILLVINAIFIQK